MNNIAIGNANIGPLCERCNKNISHLQFITMMNDLTYCLPCIVSLVREAEETIQKNKLLEEKNEVLEDRLNKLEKFVQDVWSYTPGNPGYEETKEHFEGIANPES